MATARQHCAWGVLQSGNILALPPRTTPIHTRTHVCSIGVCAVRTLHIRCCHGVDSSSGQSHAPALLYHRHIDFQPNVAPLGLRVAHAIRCRRCPQHNSLLWVVACDVRTYPAACLRVERACWGAGSTLASHPAAHATATTTLLPRYWCTIRTG